MARTPLAKAQIMAADRKNPQRYRGRNDPACSPIGEASRFLNDQQREAWQSFVAEIPWLTAADRPLLELASVLRAGFTADTMTGINRLQVYSSILSKLGATPVDRSRIGAPADDREDETEQYFSGTRQ